MTQIKPKWILAGLGIGLGCGICTPTFASCVDKQIVEIEGSFLNSFPNKAGGWTVSVGNLTNELPCQMFTTFGQNTPEGAWLAIAINEEPIGTRGARFRARLRIVSTFVGNFNETVDWSCQ